MLKRFTNQQVVKKKPAICFGWDFSNFKSNENYAGASFLNLDYSAWGVADDFWGMNFNPASINAINGFTSYSNSNNDIVSKNIVVNFLLMQHQVI